MTKPLEHPSIPHRVVILIPVLAQHDATSQEAIELWQTINASPDFEATLMVEHSSIPGIPVRRVQGIVGLLTDQVYLDADVLIFEFAIYHELHNAMLIGNGRARMVTRFHNVTPACFLPPKAAPLIQRSLEQMFHLQNSSEIWAVSQTNIDALHDIGVVHPAAHVITLAVESPALGRLPVANERVEVLYLGRFVQSKGVLDLIDAFAAAAMRCPVPMRLRLAGNANYSDPDYLARVRTRISEVEADVAYLGEISNETRDSLLAETAIFAIPSYHEGFCKPVVGAQRAGAMIAGYASYNIPHVTAGLGRLVPPGDVGGLTESLITLAQALADSTSALPLDAGTVDRTTFYARRDAHVANFEPERIAKLTLDRLRHVVNRVRPTEDPWPAPIGWSGLRLIA